MDRPPVKLTVFLGIFSGASIAAAWIATRPQETNVAIGIGLGVLAVFLAVFRVDRALTRRKRRSTDVKA